METYAKRTVREERIQMLVSLIWGTLTESSQERTEKETFLPQKARDAHHRGVRLMERTLDNEKEE